MKVFKICVFECFGFKDIFRADKVNIIGVEVEVCLVGISIEWNVRRVIKVKYGDW